MYKMSKLYYLEEKKHGERSWEKDLIRSKGSNVHCCDSYLNDVWSAIEKQLKQFRENTNAKAGYITLK